MAFLKCHNRRCLSNLRGKMFFQLTKFPNHYGLGRNVVYLMEDSWNDHSYYTLFNLTYVDDGGGVHKIGDVKIGQLGMRVNQTATLEKHNITRFDALQFEELPESYFSVGQDDSYYIRLNELGTELRSKILRGLRDIAHSQESFRIAQGEEVTGVSLMRYVSRESIEGRFRQLAHGIDEQSGYRFSFHHPAQYAGVVQSFLELNFEVTPDSLPPTNVHVLIGRNGVGKTTILDSMSRAIIAKSQPSPKEAYFQFKDNLDLWFANVGFVSFSAFDRFNPMKERRNKLSGIDYFYIGIKKEAEHSNEVESYHPKTSDDLANDFAMSISVCRREHKSERWRNAIGNLVNADPGFRESNIVTVIESDLAEDLESEEYSKSLFNRLSSGHKVVLLTLTRLIEKLEDRTLVLLDEPEAHLHPPLLSSFIRILSRLLREKNGVAIIATHSPVVLQEVPAQCVWIIRGYGLANRLTRETFGENVGLLTSTVFGLDVEESGFYNLLDEKVRKGLSFPELMTLFEGRLGAEAQAIARTLIANRYSQD